MPRVASLYLPNLVIDRLRRIEGASAAARPNAPFRDADAVGDGGWWPPARLPENTKERVRLIALRERLEQERELAPPEPGTRIEDCSCPRDGHWRPGSRWARRDELLARVETLPPHQRPPIRELGRRSEPADVPFRRGRGEPSSLSQARAPARSEAQPVVTAQRIGNRVEIAAACPIAQSLGLAPGMPLTQARAMIPGLDIRPAETEADAAFLQRLALFAARRWTPRAAVSDSSGLWLDLSGVAHLFGGERRMCMRLLRFCQRLGFKARIAVAGTAGAAHALARHDTNAVMLCPDGAEAEALAPLPLSALRIADEVLSAARRLGMETIGDLLAVPRAPLTRRFGDTLLRRLDQALGHVGEPFNPIVPEEPPAVLARFVEPILSAEAIDQALGDLMERLVDMLRERGLASKVATLICSRIDGAEQRIRIGTARATREGAHLLRLFRMKIETIDPGFGIEAMELVASLCEPLDPVPLAGDLASRPEPDLVPLIDRLAGRIGARHLFRTSAIESDVPERSLRRIPPLASPAPWPSWPRPVRLLVPPEPVDKVIAELPDQPPIRFSWRGRMHRVARADGPERVYGEWWKESGEADAVRDYFQVEDEDGARFWLYRRGDGIDGRTGDLSWWLQGAFA